ncbi:TonB-dependent receptor [Simiduia litorea]|uniref:TonB-dependent receptor plug domain-containing protein n=1 Tax=Simiduia litorea TaxID=1435348 RepID=UPI0036F37934
MKKIQALKPSLLALAVAGVIAQPSFAQQDQSLELLEEVVTIGTRKEGQSPTETLSPIDVLSGSIFSKQGATDLTDSLTKVMPSLNTQRFPIADGTAFVRPVTLRNLSPDHTLVLVNGSRRHRSALVNLQLAPLGTVNQGSQGVDFSAFPSAAIKRVEVLRDGASAQYGSDAIAGVVNLVLDDASEGFSLSGQYGEYSEGDGARTALSANAGFALGEQGFVNVTGEYSASEITSRGTARPDAAAIAEIVGADQVPYNGFGQRWGDPDIESVKLFVNAGYDVSDTVALYGHASYMDTETLSGFFYRGPVLPTAADNMANPPRTTLMIDANGDGIADAASNTLVTDIVTAGLSPDDYLTADGTSPSGYALLNPIHTQFPGGYSPLFGADISDYSLVFGAKGEFNSNLTWNLRTSTAENEVAYVLEDSINPSLGRLSPTTFNPGTLTQQESSVNADFVKTWDDSPLNVGFGLEWRNETYKIGAGDTASIAVGPTYAQFGVGSDGFQGFPTESAGSFENDSYGAYVDLETDITERWSGAIALRYEDSDAYDSTLDYKLSTRFDVSDNFALRGTVSTGFRAPTPGQVNTLNVTTTSDSSGNLVPSGTYPVSHPIASALGAIALVPEESVSYTLGLVYTPLDNVNVTLDYYNIEINDRLALKSFTIGADELQLLVDAGIPDANLLAGSNGNYFVNAFTSTVSGIDLNIHSGHELGGGNLDIDFRHNYNTQEVSDVAAGTIDAGRVYDLENQIPNHSTVLSFDFVQPVAGMELSSLLRLNRYDGWSSTGGLFGPGDASDAASYSGAILVDVQFTLDINDNYSVSIGGDNITDEYPDKEANGTLKYLGQQYAVTSPFGFNGAYWYLRANASF